MDLSRRSDFDLKEMLKRPMDPAQKRAIQMELERRRAAPSNVRENLDGAATPLTPDPEVVDPRRRAFEEAMAADGWNPDEVRVIADQEARMEEGAFNPGLWNTPRARDTNRRAARYVHDQNAREESLDRGLGEAMGHFDPPPMRTDFVREPNGMPNFAPGATVNVNGLDVPGVDLGDGRMRYRLGDVNRAQEEHNRAMQQAGGDHGVPGPQRDDGMDPTPPPKFSSPEESRDYHTRYIDPKTGRLMPSKADLAMQARGYVAAYTPEGGISYMLAAPEDVVRERFGEPQNEMQRAQPQAPREPSTMDRMVQGAQSVLSPGVLDSVRETAQHTADAIGLDPDTTRGVAEGVAGTPAGWLLDRVQRAAGATADAVGLGPTSNSGQPEPPVPGGGRAPGGGVAPRANNAGAPAPDHFVTGMSPYSQRYAGYLSGVDQRDGGTVQPRFQPELVNTPFGPKYVMMPTDATRNANRQRDLDASIRRVAEATGVSMAPGRDPANGMTIEQLRAMKPEERARYYRDMKAEQQANNKARYRETAYRAGGSQNINGGNRAFWNTIGNMSPDDYQATMREMMPMDPRRAHVEAAHNEFDTQAQLRRQTGAGFQQPTPEQQRLLQVQVAQAEGQLPLEDRAASHTDKPEIHSDEVKMVDDYVASNFSANRPLWLGGGTTTSFTLAEQQRTVDWLVNDKGYTEEKARRIVDQIVENRYAKSWRGNWDE